MAAKKIRRIIGLAGVAVNESAKAQRWGLFFEWYLLIVAFWLPIEWYLVIIKAIPNNIVMISDWLVWASFVSEAVVLVCLVRQKWYYLRGNWLNLVIILVAFPVWFLPFPHFAVIRLIRVLILARIIVPWLRTAHDALSLNRLWVTLLIFFIVTCLSGIIISLFDSGIHNPFEGIWWAWETVTTVGYGDVVPTTVAGKLMAMVVMLMGIGLFSLLTANMSAYFIGSKDRSSEILRQLFQSDKNIQQLEEKLAALDARISIGSTDKLFEYIEKLSPSEKNQLLKKLQDSSSNPTNLS
jgi:voltage-gated potassium channel